MNQVPLNQIDQDIEKLLLSQIRLQEKIKKQIKSLQPNLHDPLEDMMRRIRQRNRQVDILKEKLQKANIKIRELQIQKNPTGLMNFNIGNAQLNRSRKYYNIDADQRRQRIQENKKKIQEQREKYQQRSESYIMFLIRVLQEISKPGSDSDQQMIKIPKKDYQNILNSRVIYEKQIRQINGDKSTQKSKKKDGGDVDGFILKKQQKEKEGDQQKQKNKSDENKSQSGSEQAQKDEDKKKMQQQQQKAKKQNERKQYLESLKNSPAQIVFPQIMQKLGLKQKWDEYIQKFKNQAKISQQIRQILIDQSKRKQLDQNQTNNSSLIQQSDYNPQAQRPRIQKILKLVQAKSTLQKFHKLWHQQQISDQQVFNQVLAKYDEKAKKACQIEIFTILKQVYHYFFGNILNFFSQHNNSSHRLEKFYSADSLPKQYHFPDSVYKIFESAKQNQKQQEWQQLSKQINYNIDRGFKQLKKKIISFELMSAHLRPQFSKK